MPAKKAKKNKALAPKATAANTQHAAVATLVKLSKAATAAADPFLVIKSDEKGRVTTTESKLPALGAEKSMAREYMRSQFGQKPYKTTLIVDTGQRNSGAGSTLQYNFGIDPVQSADYSGFSGLFDDFRSVSAEVKTCAYISTAGGGTVVPYAVVVFDPAENTAVTTVANGMSYSRFAGPWSIIGGAVIGIPGPQPVSNHGMITLSSGRFVQSTLPVISTGTGIAPVGGDWCAITSTSAAAGYFKWFVESPGGTAVISIRMFCSIEVEFRFRG